MQLVGINNPGEVKLAILEDWIRTEYGGFTINEVKVAFKQMVANDFIDHYQNFSPAYFSQVMDRYKKKANEVRKMIPQEREQAIPHLTDLEIIDYSYQEYKVLENRTFDKLFNPLSVFTKLHNSGIKTWSKEDGAVAKKKLMEIITYKANKMDIISAKQYRDEWTEQWLKNQARAVAVALFFEEQIKLGKVSFS
jgi:antitoxin component YwqK of YwqJK toxin-antitoxin module